MLGFYLQTLSKLIVAFSFLRFYSNTYYTNDGMLYKRVVVYNIYKEKDLLGQYFHSGSRHSYRFAGSYFKIVSTAKWYERPDFKITDQQTNEVISSLVIPRYYNDTFYNSPETIYSNPFMKVVLQGAAYTFMRERPEVEYCLFDKKTWGHYAFSLHDIKGVSAAAYTFKIEQPLLDGSISTFCNMEGDITACNDNIHLLFAGLFLLEQVIYNWARNA